jgi:O-antigen/teichoic acid export membrane protein
LIRRLFHYGSWITVGNILSPTLTYGDRFVIAATLGAASIAFYTPAFEVVNRLLLIPTGMLTVLFPALARSLSAQRADEARAAYQEALELLALVFLPVMVLIVADAPIGLRLWLGGEYALIGAVPLQILTVGIVVQVAGLIWAALLQASKAFATPTRIQLGIVVPYFAALVVATLQFGLVGTAVVWACRAVAETALLGVSVRSVIGPPALHTFRLFILFVLSFATALLIAQLKSDIATPVVSAAAAAAITVVAGRFVLGGRTRRRLAITLRVRSIAA